MIRPDCLSPLHERNKNQSAPYPNLVKLKKCFAKFTRFNSDTNQLMQQYRPAPLEVVGGCNQIELVAQVISKHTKTTLGLLDLIKGIESAVSDADIDHRCREWPPPNVGLL